MPKSIAQTLISVDRNLHLGDCCFDRDMMTPDCSTPWLVRMQRLHGGKQEGVDLITLDNGRLKLRICPTRGMSIINAEMGPVRLGWDSPVKEVVHPMFVDLQRRGRTGWLEGFNEFLVRCGLEFMGPPCQDDQHLAVGEPPASDTTLHGKIANTPASRVEVIAQTQAPYAITLRGIVHERAMYGPKLQLTTDITVVPGDNTFTVHDTITNNAGQPAEVCLLYHINQGRPILEPGAKLVAPVQGVTPRDQGYTPDQIKHFDQYGPPAPASTEQAYFLDLKPDSDNRVSVLLHNKNKDVGLSISWDKKKLPRFTQWKALHDERDGYVTGLEPCVTYPHDKPTERDAKRVLTLKPGASYKAQLDFAVLDTKDRVLKITQI